MSTTKKKILNILLVAVVAFTSIFILSACGEEKEPYIEAHNLITEYYMGEDLILEGASVRFYEDKDSKEYETIPLTREMVTGFSTDTAGSRTMTITYKTYTTKLDYTVKELTNEYALELYNQARENLLSNPKWYVSSEETDVQYIIDNVNNVQYYLSGTSESWTLEENGSIVEYTHDKSEQTYKKRTVVENTFDEYLAEYVFPSMTTAISQVVLNEDRSVSIIFIETESQDQVTTEEKYEYVIKNGYFVSDTTTITTNKDGIPISNQSWTGTYEYNTTREIPEMPQNVVWQEN